MNMLVGLMLANMSEARKNTCKHARQHVILFVLTFSNDCQPRSTQCEQKHPPTSLSAIGWSYRCFCYSHLRAKLSEKQPRGQTSRQTGLLGVQGNQTPDGILPSQEHLQLNKKRPARKRDPMPGRGNKWMPHLHSRKKVGQEKRSQECAAKQHKKHEFHKNEDVAARWSCMPPSAHL